jgi:branched-chain amino acid transport system permease protein
MSGAAHNLSAETAATAPAAALSPAWSAMRTEMLLTGGALVLAVALCATFAGSFKIFVLNQILLACIGALGLNLLMGTAGQVSIGNAAFLTCGAFTAVVCERLGLPFPVDLAVAMVTAGLFGIVVGLPALRIKGIYLILSTMAAHFLALFIAEKYQETKVGSAGFQVDQIFVGSLVTVQRNWSFLLLAVVLMVMFALGRIQTGRTGRAWRMIRDREDAAPAMGVATARYKLYAFVISSAVIGLQGALMAHFMGGVSNESFTLHTAIAAIAMILIGGMGSVAGSVIGAAIVTSLPHVTPPVVDSLIGGAMASRHAAQVALILYGVLIIVFISYAREGVRGWIVWLARKAAGARPRGTAR